MRSRAGVELRRVPAASGDPVALLEAARPHVVVLGRAAARRPDLADVIGTLAARAPVVVVGELDQAAAAVEALRAGAADYVARGAVDVADRIARAAGSLQEATASSGDDALAGLLGTSAGMQRVRALVRTAGRTGAAVLLEGETGTGKEVVARAVHALGARARKPFIPVNCAAVPEALAESEFFGHARGAFTGALDAR